MSAPTLNELLGSLVQTNRTVAPEFKSRLHQLTVDQLKHEENVIENAIKQQLSHFSEKQTRDKVDKYAQLSQAHQNLFGNGAGDGIISKLKADSQIYNQLHEKLQLSLQNLDLEQIETKRDVVQDSAKNLDKLVEIVNTPNLLTQCLQQDQLEQAVKLIRSYDSKLYSGEGSQILDLVDKEVKIANQKLIRIIYIKLESSFLGIQGKMSTKDLISLLVDLGEPKHQIDQILMISRARFIKDQVQAQVLKAGSTRLENVQTQQTITTQVLKYLKLNIEEFVAFKFDYEEWLIDRLSEVRSIIQVFVQKLTKVADLVSMQNCIQEFNIINSELPHSLECGDIFEKRLSEVKVHDQFSNFKIQSSSDLKTVTDKLKLIFNELSHLKIIRRHFRSKYQDDIINKVFAQVVSNALQQYMLNKGEVDDFNENIKIQLQSFRTNLETLMSHQEAKRLLDLDFIDDLLL